MYKNMKIEINEEQPLDEVVKEMERKGYKTLRLHCNLGLGTIITWKDGGFTNYHHNVPDNSFCNITTLAELKEM